MTKLRNEVLETKKRTKTLTIKFEYRTGDLTPHAIDVDGSQCSMAEMMLGLMRLYATIHESDPTLFLSTAFEKVMEYGLEKGIFTKQKRKTKNGEKNGNK